MAFLASKQQPDGSFESFSSPSRKPFEPKFTYLTTFAPALILTAISSLNEPEAKLVRKRLASWLAAQRSPAWSFNYWSASAPERETMPYPDDLDDTFCALIALRLHNPSLIDETCLANVVKLLIATESQVGGPYKTWLVPDKAPKVWQDVDLAVNSNIACFLRMVAEPLPNLTGMIEEVIASRNLKSPYYPSEYPLAYYMARAYDGSHAHQLAAYILKRRRGSWWGSPMRTALAVSSLNGLGQSKLCQTATAQRLVDEQLPDGSWPAEAFCLDPSIQQKKHYSGSAALTTALVLEALGLWNARQAPVTSAKNHTAIQDKTTENLRSLIASAALKEIDGLRPALKRHGKRIIDDVQSHDKHHEITLLPHLFNNSLKHPLSPTSPDVFMHLGLANLYGWAAYTVYDDFLDGEGEPKLLSAANTALRYSVKHFDMAVPGNAAFQRLAERIFNTIDGANAWDQDNCMVKITGETITIGELPDYSRTLNLADRSLGHALAPLGILAASGITPADPRAAAIKRAISHYLVARQLNDDMHDWEQDLRAGIITYVVAAILRELELAPGNYEFADLVPKMKRQFWHRTLISVCKKVTSHTALARRAARSSGLLNQQNIITSLTYKIDDSVENTLKEQSKAEQFLAAYRG
jgi:hypothetical protein